MDQFTNDLKELIKRQIENNAYYDQLGIPTIEGVSVDLEAGQIYAEVTFSDSEVLYGFCVQVTVDRRHTDES